jgi:PIN domain nuclease of toxin-antitoxin system
VFLWWRGDSRQLNARARRAIASAWEAALEIALGRLRIPDSIEAGVLESGFEKLAIGFAQAEAAARLPAHHTDPFDRMLVAQAQIEGLTLVSHDRRLGRYDVELLWT